MSSLPKVVTHLALGDGQGMLCNKQLYAFVYIFVSRGVSKLGVRDACFDAFEIRPYSEVGRAWGRRAFLAALNEPIRSFPKSWVSRPDKSPCNSLLNLATITSAYRARVTMARSGINLGEKTAASCLLNIPAKALGSAALGLAGLHRDPVANLPVKHPTLYPPQLAPGGAVWPV